MMQHAYLLVSCILSLFITSNSFAASSEELRLKRPALFDKKTGYRIDRYRSPIPDDIPGLTRINAQKTRVIIDNGGIAIDVFGAQQSRFDELDGTWMVSGPRMSVPGAVWLPEVGRGTDNEVIQSYFKKNLERISCGDKDRPLVFFCIADCWMSWNAAQRAKRFGHTTVYWFAEGTDGWLDEGWGLDPIDPVTVNVD